MYVRPAFRCHRVHEQAVSSRHRWPAAGQTEYAAPTLDLICCVEQWRSPPPALAYPRPARAGAAFAVASRRAMLALRHRGLAATGTVGRGLRPSPTRVPPRADPRRPADRSDGPSITQSVSPSATIARRSRRPYRVSDRKLLSNSMIHLRLVAAHTTPGGDARRRGSLP